MKAVELIELDSILEKKEHEGRYSTLKTIVINKLKGHFQDVSEWSTIAHKCIPIDDMETNNYKLYCLKKSPLKKKGLQHKGPGSHPEKATNLEYSCQVKCFNVDPE